MLINPFNKHYFFTSNWDSQILSSAVFYSRLFISAHNLQNVCLYILLSFNSFCNPSQPERPVSTLKWGPRACGLALSGESLSCTFCATSEINPNVSSKMFLPCTWNNIRDYGKTLWKVNTENFIYFKSLNI